MWACCGPSLPHSGRWPPTSDPTVSRLVDSLAAAGARPRDAIRTARADAHEYVWKPARSGAPDREGHVIVDLDGVLLVAHSEKQDASTWKRADGHHPLMGFVYFSRP